MKTVYKYGTGHIIPEDAIYLTTITEKRKLIKNNEFTDLKDGVDIIEYTEYPLVWHYFLVEIKE